MSKSNTEHPLPTPSEPAPAKAGGEGNRIWHPFTQHALSGPAIPIDRARGCYLYTKDGRRIIDAISSWWVNTHGHAHPKIVAAIQEQAEKLEQIIFAGFTHDPAEQLAERLLARAPDNLTKVFYSDSGSTSVEVALKMAIGYWEHTGKPRSKIIAFEGGYHGDTFGGMSAGGRSLFNKLYEPFLFEVEHVPFPAPGNESQTLDRLKKALSQNNAAAFIFEPLIQGASGMRIYSPEILKKMVDLCRAHGTLLIADEVMTGFGRTGTFLACEQAGITPDLICLSKGLTGGFLPMGATLCTEEIYRAFYHKDRSKMFFHSSSFTGNAIACAAALAGLQIWEEEPVMDRIHTIARSHQNAATRLAKHKNAQNIRTLGTILALDIQEREQNYLSPLGPRLYDFFLKNNVLLRPLGNTVYILPPYCISQKDLEEIYDIITLALDHIGNDRAECAA